PTKFLSIINPFNRETDYHPYCVIGGSSDPKILERCRLGCPNPNNCDPGITLPDLDTENPSVIQRLGDWFAWLQNTYGLDAWRLDAVKHVRADFWPGFVARAGTFAIGEVFDGRSNYVGSYQSNMPSVFNFPLYFTILDIFQRGVTWFELENRIRANRQSFKDVGVLGNFLDNHDVPRFLSQVNFDGTKLRNALALIFFTDGIPFVYYGTEQGFAGGNDPNNREPLWTNFNPNGPHVDFLARLNALRKYMGQSLTTSRHEFVWTTQNYHIFRRANALVIVNSGGKQYTFTQSIPVSYPEGTILQNIFNPANDELVVRRGNITINVTGGEPKIYYPAPTKC
ncbi:hypothetical protein HK102_006008, partial [Quaeritorhiza haematococci]